MGFVLESVPSWETARASELVRSRDPDFTQLLLLGGAALAFWVAQRFSAAIRILWIKGL